MLSGKPARHFPKASDDGVNTHTYAEIVMNMEKRELANELHKQILKEDELL